LGVADETAAAFGGDGNRWVRGNTGSYESGARRGSVSATKSAAKAVLLRSGIAVMT